MGGTITIIPNDIQAILLEVLPLLRSRQFQRAEDLGAKCIPGILFTGHSLGGGLAACAAGTDKKAVTFNAMGVTPKSSVSSYDSYSFGALPQNSETSYPASTSPKRAASSKITNYCTSLDILTNVQEVTILAVAQGETVNLDEQNAEKKEKLQKLLVDFLHKDLLILLVSLSSPMIMLAALEHLVKYLYDEEVISMLKESFNAHGIEVVKTALQEYEAKQAEQKGPKKK